MASLFVATSGTLAPPAKPVPVSAAQPGGLKKPAHAIGGAVLPILIAPILIAILATGSSSWAGAHTASPAPVNPPAATAHPAATPAITPFPAARGATSALSLLAEQPLRFGTLVVTDSGARTVHASGEVSNDNILPMGYAGVGPAEFTLSYDRGTASTQPISVVVRIMLAAMPPLAQGGVTGALSQFETDLPGAEQLAPGRPVTVTIAHCATRVCTLGFHVGARLSITRTSGGGSLAIAPPLSASVVSVTP